MKQSDVKRFIDEQTLRLMVHCIVDVYSQFFLLLFILFFINLHNLHKVYEVLLYTMQNKFSNCFCMCQIHNIRLLLSDYCIKIWRKESRMIIRSVCSSVTSVFKTCGRKGQFWSCAGAKIFMKWLFSHQNEKEEEEKKMNMLREIGVQILKYWRFPLILRYRLKTAFLIRISWITFACIAIWFPPTC